MKAYLRTRKRRHFIRTRHVDSHLLNVRTYRRVHLECKLYSCVDTRRDFRYEGRKLSSVEARAGHATGRACIRFASNRGGSTIDVNGTIVLRPIIARSIPIDDDYPAKSTGDTYEIMMFRPRPVIIENCPAKAS